MHTLRKVWPDIQSAITQALAYIAKAGSDKIPAAVTKKDKTEPLITFRLSDFVAWLSDIAIGGYERPVAERKLKRGSKTPVKGKIDSEGSKGSEYDMGVIDFSEDYEKEEKNGKYRKQ